MRYFFEIAYLGTAYNGWQTQPNGTGVQEVVEGALSRIFRRKVSIVGSGRTDTGVHCSQQFFHTDLDEPFSRADLIHKLNSLLPRDIAIHSIRAVQAEASARYDAIKRTYRYHITTRKNPLLVGRALYVFKRLDVKKMSAAARLLLGDQDFECFSKIKTDVNHFRCAVSTAKWMAQENDLIFEISANRFLRGMVRAVVGTLLDVGTGKITVKDFQQIIENRDRKKAGMNVAPEGLTLVKVEYKKSIFLSETKASPSKKQKGKTKTK
jgi:tRNA pseudouridine38-40 synthase